MPREKKEDKKSIVFIAGIAGTAILSLVLILCTGDKNTIPHEVSPASNDENEHDFIAAGDTYDTGDTLHIHLPKGSQFRLLLVEVL